MSDEGVVNVEDDGPAPAAAPAEPAAPVAAAPAEPEPAADAPAEVDAVEVGGQKYVPVGAVIAERKQRQALQEKANRVDELEKFARDAEPYVKFLQANPGLINRQPAPQAPQQPVTDPNAELIAKTMDLYTPDGKPDIARGAVMSGLVASMAKQIAQQTIAPIQQESAQTKSAQNFQVALQFKNKEGRSPSPQALATIWKQMDPRQTANPEVASILALTALGLDSVNQAPAPAPASLPPIVTEGQGAAPRRASLSNLEQAIARDRGIPEAKWAENTKGFTPGRANTLED